MAKALDRSKPFGSIFNDDQGRFYEQDGEFFVADGSQWQPKGAEKTRPASKRAEPTEAAPAAVVTQLDAQLLQEGGAA